MDIVSVGYRILLAFAIGAAIGLEREINEKSGVHENKPSAILGIRSFSLSAILGSIVGALYPNFAPLSLLIGGAFLIMLIVFYVLDVLETKDRGFTTEVAVIFSFVIGILLMLNVIPIQLTLAISVSILLLLSQKDLIKETVRSVRRNELNAFISFAIIALAILPFLPNESFSLNDMPGLKDLIVKFNLDHNKLAGIDLINPFKTWLYVALITGVDLVGYVLERTVGAKRGWLLASVAGGFVSSTATTQSLAQESRSSKRVNHLVAAAILANIVSFFQVAIIIAPINSIFFVSLIPVLVAMILSGTGALIYFLRSKEKAGKSSVNKADQPEEQKTKIIDLKAALKFAFLFVTISIVSKMALILFGNSGFLATTGLGAIIGLDAVIINTAQLVGKNIDVSLAIIAFVLANAVNLIGKVMYSFSLGSRQFTLRFGLSMAGIILASLLGIVLT